jgi:hypothetical protein
MYAFFPSSDRANDSGAAQRRQHRQLPELLRRGLMLEGVECRVQ